MIHLPGGVGINPNSFMAYSFVKDEDGVDEDDQLIIYLTYSETITIYAAEAKAAYLVLLSLDGKTEDLK